MARGSRDDLITALVAAIGPGRTRVAVDGPPGAGKTTLADELAVVLRAQGRQVVRDTIDDYLFPREHRYRRGEFSGVGCYRDAHDNEKVRRLLRGPLGPDTVLLFDGVFLLRPELADCWEFSVFVTTADDTLLRRALVREQSAPAVTERRWRERYLPAQRLYAAEARPTERADVVVHNDDPHRPRWSCPA